jgi:hypothetical protein
MSPALFHEHTLLYFWAFIQMRCEADGSFCNDHCTGIRDKGFPPTRRAAACVLALQRIAEFRSGSGR